VIGILRRPNADMSECVQDALVHKNVIGEHKIGDPINVLLLGRVRRLLRRAGRDDTHTASHHSQ
jgi:hypothetical protein